MNKNGTFKIEFDPWRPSKYVLYVSRPRAVFGFRWERIRTFDSEQEAREWVVNYGTEVARFPVYLP